MYGPNLIARTLTRVRAYGTKKNPRNWQYNSRSDVHSQVACWSVAFDLLMTCQLLRQHTADGKVGFGLNHEMRDFHNNKEKDLDLVLCRPHASQIAKYQRSKLLRRPIQSFADLAEHLQLPLDAAERADLVKLPVLPIVPVGMVHVALEAKAAMTEFSKAESRLFSELDSSISVINGHAQHAIAGALVMVNVASQFISPIINRADYGTKPISISQHRNQPKPAQGVIDTIKQLRRRSSDRDRGFDAIGIVVVEMVNDGSPCRVVTSSPPGLPSSDSLHYDQMIARAAHVYSQRFASV